MRREILEAQFKVSGHFETRDFDRGWSAVIINDDGVYGVTCLDGKYMFMSMVDDQQLRHLPTKEAQNLINENQSK